MIQSFHASCVAFGARGLLIRGASGSGKSSLALAMMARGAALIADDVTRLAVRNGQLVATCPPQGRGLIEARNMGILRTARVQDQTILALVADLDDVETERLPVARHCDILGVTLDLVRRIDGPHFADALLCYLEGQRHA
ncbi:HPr kinase/phosphorylase [Neogemmobacter tilapiae]|uniref:HPr kinase n=1 Tax=Neogemmobacter tilapiae TaxID=875041 RepID=A0A918WP05_9RHOB|nr:HPr kinase/phosphatase C-terminal domain-containing protein [Gemmobacter tilapiae]GHC64487.1 HPr kinase [Gemmobacter tilapiae]